MTTLVLTQCAVQVLRHLSSFLKGNQEFTKISYARGFLHCTFIKKNTQFSCGQTRTY